MDSPFECLSHGVRLEIVSFDSPSGAGTVRCPKCDKLVDWDVAEEEAARHSGPPDPSKGPPRFRHVE